MSDHYAELLMYVAPQQVQQANEQWLTCILERLGATRLSAAHLDLRSLWRAPQLLLTQTCGYPLMTELRGQVQLIGRPRYELPHSSAGEHCSLLLTRYDPERVSKGVMLGVEDVKDILAVTLLRVIPESQAVLKASNQGVPVILDDQSDAGQAYSDAVDRLLGKTVEHRFLDVKKKGFFERIFGGN